MSHEVITKFTFRDVELEFDIADADNSDRFEQAVNRMAEDEKGLPKTGKLSTIYRAQCRLIKDFFDNCIEEGAGEKICTKADNVRICYDAYDEFLKFVSAQKTGIMSYKDVFSKYSNREQRRHPQNPGQNQKHGNGLNHGKPYIAK